MGAADSLRVEMKSWSLLGSKVLETERPVLETISERRNEKA